MKNDLILYLQKQIRTTNERLQRFTHNLANQAYPKRALFDKISQYVSDFLEKKSKNSMIIMPGFRGVGKTTLMAQVCAHYKNHLKHFLFLSVEDLNNLFDVGVAELIAAYEDIIGCDLESIKEPVLFFFDEIQTDPKWAITLKSIYEKTSQVFFCCTGSSAVTLQTTSNVARRAVFEKIPPISFIEYEMIQHNITPNHALANTIRQALYFSNTESDAFDALYKIKTAVNQYWSTISRADIRKFLAYGTLPFSLNFQNETAIYESISLLLDKMINQDLPLLNRFSTETLGSVKRLLFVMAENDVTSLSTLEKTFSGTLSRITLSHLLDAMEKAELLIKIPAYGSNMTAAKKANKYLFMSPAIRMSFFYYTGLESTYRVRQGKLLEDYIGSHLYREFILKDQGALRYDSAEGGADFILQILNKKQIIIELGMGNKDKKQILNSAKRINSDYNLVFSETELTIDREHHILFVPLNIVLLAG